MWLNVCRSRWSIHLRSVQKKKEDFTAFGQKGGKKYQSGNTVLPIKYSTKKPKKELLIEENWSLSFDWPSWCAFMSFFCPTASGVECWHVFKTITSTFCTVVQFCLIGVTKNNNKKQITTARVIIPGHLGAIVSNGIHKKNIRYQGQLKKLKTWGLFLS